MNIPQQIEVTIKPSPILSPADERFILFLKKVSFPVTESQIIDWYKEWVQLTPQRRGMENTGDVWQKVYRDYTDAEIRTNALAWFDRSLGRTIRKAIIPNEAVKLLTPVADVLSVEAEPQAP